MGVVTSIFGQKKKQIHYTKVQAMNGIMNKMHNRSDNFSYREVRHLINVIWHSAFDDGYKAREYSKDADEKRCFDKFETLVTNPDWWEKGLKVVETEYEVIGKPAYNLNDPDYQKYLELKKKFE